MNIRKTAAAVFIVVMFLTSSTLVVNAGTEDIKTIRMYNAYADELDDVKTDIDVNYDSSPDLEFSVQNPIKLQPNVKIPPKKYAVIMVGRYFGLWYWGHPRWNYNMIQQYYTWYLRDAGKLYTTLHGTYGYDEDNIFLLVRLLPGCCFDIPESFNPDWIDYTSSKENLEAVLGTFKPGGENELTEQDQLFICFIDHGGNRDENYCGNSGYYINEFISPKNDIDTDWIDEYKTYDTYERNAHDFYHDTGTGALFKKAKNGWSDWLVLTLGETKTIKGFRILARKSDYLDQMNVTFYKSDSDTPVKSVTLTDWPNYKYKYVEFEGEEIEVNKVKIRFHENHSFLGFNLNWAVVKDFNFWESDSCGQVGRTYFGCPLQSIPDVLVWIFGNDWQVLRDYELKSYSNGIKARMIFALQPCCSGGFLRELDELSPENRIVCTASRGFELAVASWIGCFRDALNKYDSEDPDNLPDADYNNDTKISILEAYRYAAEKVEEQLNKHPEFPPQHPLIEDNGDGIGHHFCETNYYGNSSGKDGYLAANTFL